jgi:hypothetical protein
MPEAQRPKTLPHPYLTCSSAASPTRSEKTGNDETKGLAAWQIPKNSIFGISEITGGWAYTV